MGKGVLELRRAIPHGLAIAGGIRRVVLNPRLSGRPPACRELRAGPVDVTTGELLIDVTDVALPASLPVTIRRIHTSAARIGHVLGSAWVTNLDHRLEVDDQGIAYLGEGATLQLFPHPVDGQPVEPSEGARLQLRSVLDSTGLSPGSGYTVTDPLTGLTEHFAQLSGLPVVTALPLAATTDRAGRRIDYSYDADGYLTGIENSGGYRIRVERTDDGLISGFVLLGDAFDEPDTTLVRYGYDSAGRLTEVVNSSGRPTRYSYDTVGRLVGWEDRNGIRSIYEYDGDGRVVRTGGPDATLRARFRYQPALPPGNGTGRAAGPARTLLTDSLGHSWTYEVNAAGQLTAAIDPTGACTTRTWDRYHRLLSTTDPIGRTTRHAYDRIGNRIVTTLPDGQTVSTHYNSDNLPVSVHLPDGAVWSADYDVAGLLLSLSDPDGNITRYGYDEHGHLTTVVDALDQTTRVACNPAGLPVAVTDPLGSTTGITRDVLGRSIRVADALDAVTQLGWTPEGLLTSRADPDGATWSWTWDGEDSLRTATDPAGNTTAYALTPFDRTARVESPDGAVTQYVYDTEHRLTAVINPLGLVWRYTRDPRGLVVAETDFNGALTTYQRDAAGQITQQVNAVGQRIDYTYDLRGNPVSERAAGSDGSRGATTWFEFDVQGRLVRATSPEADLRLDRDALGRVVAESVNGRTVTNRYDALGRRTARTTPSGVSSAWTYDPAGRPLTLTSGGHSIDFSWDRSGRLIGQRLGELTLQQTFDPLGRLLTQTVALASEAPSAGFATDPFLTGAPGWSPAEHHATPARAPNGSDHRLRREHRYDVAGHLIGLDDRHRGAHAFTVDEVGQVTAVAGPGGGERYGYDLAGNLSQATWHVDSGPGHGSGAGHGDGTGSGDGTGCAGGCDRGTGARGSREYTGTLIRRAGTSTYTHDGAGRLIRRRQVTLSGTVRVWRYTWDARDRLSAVTTPDGEIWRYLYDALGRRLGKQRLGGGGGRGAGAVAVAEEVRFSWEGATVAEQVHRPSGVVTTWDYRPAGFVPVAQQIGIIRPGPERAGIRDRSTVSLDQRPTGSPGPPDQGRRGRQFHAIVTDLAGAPTALVAPDGNLTREPERSLWGVCLGGDRGDRAGVVVACPLRFPGQYHDSETGLHYNVFRHYDPSTARYATPDPLGLCGGPNPHGCVPNPLEGTGPVGSAFLDGAGAVRKPVPVCRTPASDNAPYELTRGPDPATHQADDVPGYAGGRHGGAECDVAALIPAGWAPQPRPWRNPVLAGRGA